MGHPFLLSILHNELIILEDKKERSAVIYEHAEENIVNDPEIERIRSAIGVPVGDPHFFRRAFAYVAKRRASAVAGEKNPFIKIFSDEYEELTQRLSLIPLQDGNAVRHLLRARLLATALIDEKGNLDRVALKGAIDALAAHTYFLGPDRQEEGVRQARMLRMLRLLDTRKDLVLALQNINKPHMHKYAEQVIRSTLQLPSNVSITNVHTRRAALSALLCTLRQSLGSCFATAPAIFIHDEFPQLFLTDINEMLATGQLKRIAAGVEYIVPLSRGWGIGDLKKGFFLSGNRERDVAALAVHPGLLAAFKETELVATELSLKEMLLRVLPDERRVVTAEELISLVLLRYNNITIKDLEDFKKRPHEMIQGSLMMHVPTSGKASGGKGQACIQYFLSFENVKNSFKSFADNPLLRSWEYTVASFAESKADFAKWNFYSSLGLRPEDKGGLGQCLYDVVKEKLDEENNKVQQVEREYERAFYEAKTMEARFRGATSEQDARWIRIEYQMKVNEMHIVQEERDRAHVMAKRLAKLYDKLIDFYIDSFPRFFQEVYDPEMIDLSSGSYDDSPAGFRLLFKHGRANTSQWTSIDDPQAFIQSIVSFFMMTEREMDSDPQLKGMQSCISAITTKMINHVRTNDFLESAFDRMAVSHGKSIIKDPLDNLDKVEAKPWAYTSGGNLEALLSTYFRKGEKLASATTWVETPKELLVFIIDTLKQIPPGKMDIYKEDGEAALLMNSPTHVFLLKPGRSPLKEAWENPDFTYTWVRDNIVIPAERVVDGILLDEEMMDFLVHRLAEHISPDFHPRYFQVFGKITGTMSPPFFRNYIVETMLHDQGLRRRGIPALNPSTIDALLYTTLPLFPAHQLRNRVKTILSSISELTVAQREEALTLLEGLSSDNLDYNIYSASRLQEICQSLVCLVTNKTSFSQDLQKKIVAACRSEGYALPSPVLFADTNWASDDFAFVVNPGNGKFELWRMDRQGLAGEPMTAWNQWIDGARKSPTWGIYYRRYEYTV